MRGGIALQKHRLRPDINLKSLSRKLWECARVLAPSLLAASLVFSALRHQRACQHRLDDFPTLIRRYVAQAKNPMGRTGSRGTQFKDLGIHREHVPGPHRIRPAQFIHAETDCALGEVQRLHEQAHAHRRGVPATGNKSFENASLGAPPAEVKHLRIKFVSELDDLFYGHVQRLRFEPIACFQIIEITLLHDENDQSALLRDPSQPSNT